MQPRFSLLEAATPLITAAVLLLGSVVLYPVRFYWPLAVGALVAIWMARRSGFTFTELGRAALAGIKSTFIAVSILLLVGALIGVWVGAGTVPAMVYYGLQVAEPRFLLPAAYLLALTVSMMLGTSIGTLSTLGVAIMGVAQGAGLPLAPVAGALVSGALFGDRSSPLSGSLNLNLSMTQTEMRKAQGALAPTGVVVAILCLAVYAWLGGRLPVAPGAQGSGLGAALAAQVTIGPWLLVPPVLVLVLAFLRVPVRWALGAGIAAGAVVGVLVGGAELPGLVRAALFGQISPVAEGTLSRILSGGGIFPMVHQFLLILVAGAFNGIMEATGMMPMVIERLVAGVRRPVGLVFSTMLISVSVSMVAANQALAIIVPGRMLRPAYDRAHLPSALLTRALADSGTLLAGIIPWNLMGVLAAASLGVPAHAFAPYAFLALLMPPASLIYAYAEEKGLFDGGSATTATEFSRGD